MEKGVTWRPTAKRKRSSLRLPYYYVLKTPRGEAREGARGVFFSYCDVGRLLIVYADQTAPDSLPEGLGSIGYPEF